MRTYLAILLFGIGLGSCGQDNPKKLKGLSLVGSRDLPSPSDWEKIQDLGANSVTLMPYAYTKKNSDTLISYTDWQWSGESLTGIDSCVKSALAKDLIPIIKPHLWLMGGSYTGKMTFADPLSRKKWNLQYISYITSFAKIAQKHRLPLFCLANEMQSFWEETPEDFELLIRECRKVFDGKLIYAANWDEYASFPFWNALDAVGINAYFPLKNEAEASSNWQRITQEIEGFADSLDLSVYFTELGYRSINNPFDEPWVSDTEEEENQGAQAAAWEIFFKGPWQSAKVQGVFVWKWFPRFTEDRRKHGFTPQGKKAETIISKYFLE